MGRISEPGATKGSRLTGLITAIIVATALLYLNLDGYQKQLDRRIDFFGKPPIANWVHGWPRAVVVRNCAYPLSGVYSPDGKSSYGPHGVYSRWPVDDARILYHGFTPLFLDLLFFISVVPGAAFAVPRLWYWLKTCRKFGLRFMLSVTTLVAVALAVLPSKEIWHVVHRAITEPASPSDRFRYALEFLAITISLVGAVLTVYSMMYFAMRLFRYCRPRVHLASESLVVSRVP